MGGIVILLFTARNHMIGKLTRDGRADEWIQGIGEGEREGGDPRSKPWLWWGEWVGVPSSNLQEWAQAQETVA